MTSSSERAASASRSRSERASSIRYSAFLPREADDEELPRSQPGDALARGELPGDVVPRAETLDEAAADRRCGAERDLLRRDRDHERLERPWVERRTEAGQRPRLGAELRVAVGPGVEGLELERETEQPAHLVPTSAPPGSTRTPPGAASILTSRPAATRWSPPSCQTVAPSEPKARNRTVESSKSYGSGTEEHAQTASQRLAKREVLERLECDSFAEVVGQAVPGEDPRSRESDAAVREAVADVGELAEARDIGALARLAADGALLASGRAPATRRDAGRAGSRAPRLDALAGEDRLDQLVEAARDDERPVHARELAEARTGRGRSHVPTRRRSASGARTLGTPMR